MSWPRLGFIGGGKMATALSRGVCQAGLTTSDRIVASDVLPEARQALAQSAGIDVVAENRGVVERSDVLVLAVKPQVMAQVLGELRPLLQPRHLVVSIAAGITLQQLARGLGETCRIIRVMPNTPCLVGASASGYTLGPATLPEDRKIIEEFLGSVGKAFSVPESLLDAVTGLSGSGPAFVATIIEALSDGGVRMGLPRDVATTLAAQTVFGTAKMLLETGVHTGQMKDMVTSPGGTTIAGIHALERGGLRAALIDAVEAATRRASELGKL
jgi:pyrroline-5-carboxylate reductase